MSQTDQNKELDELFGTAQPQPTEGWQETGLAGDVWNFEEKKELIGLYTKMKSDVGPNNSKMYVIENRDDNKEYSVWGSTVLDNRFSEINIGEEVKIVFNGITKNKKGTEYKDFSVWHRPAPFKKVG